ncbi:MAG TPA: hypothetical protein VFI41_05415 [Gemmatimonadales bacterium]|nr:hypothetical protein [Gemmatimonadales bacterium]
MADTPSTSGPQGSGITNRPMLWQQVEQDYPEFIQWSRDNGFAVPNGGPVDMTLYGQMKTAYNNYLQSLIVP